MTQVLIVDDEIHAVRGLQAGVQWGLLKVDGVMTAHSMKQAQDIFAEQPVDILISDIEMPNGTGLELAGWVREHYPRTETVFLTCHSDFAYAKRAIQLDSFEYLLKPVDYGELEEVIRRAIEKKEKEERLLTFEKIYNHYQKLWETHQPLMKERFWQELIERSIPAREDKINEKLADYGLPGLRDLKFVPVLLRVDRWHKELTPRDEKILDYALRNAAEERIAGNERNAGVISWGRDRFAVFIPYLNPAQLRQIREDCTSFIEGCNQYLYCDLRCYIGEPARLQELPDMGERLAKMDRENVAVVNEPMLLWDPHKVRTGVERPNVASWAEWMKQGAKEKLEEEINRFFDTLRQAKGCVGASYLHALYQDLLQMVFYVLQAKGLQANQVFAANLLTERQEAVLRSLHAFEEWIRYVMEVAMNQIHCTEGSLSVVDKVKRYAAEHITDPQLSREDLAGHVYLNPDYLTRLFKKETGLSISDYLQQQRVHYAKELLASTDLSVSDVALAAGYSNLSYFSTIFKKVLGMNPNEYRKRMLRSAP